MSFTSLNENKLSDLDNRIKRPNYNRSEVRTSIVHFGVGGFHRSHQAFYLHQLLQQTKELEWGICGMGLRQADKKIEQVFEKQDCLYTLITEPAQGVPNCEIIGSITEFILAFENLNTAIEKLIHPDIKIVSLTITEGGYNLDTGTGEFDYTNSAIQYDWRHPTEPKTIFGILTVALKKRKELGIPAFTIMSCDNIQHNGDITKKMLLAYVNHVDKILAQWIEKEVCFPNSMVDRITPVTSQKEINHLQNEYALNDEWPVVCEPYIQWVLEDKFSAGRPLLEKVGVQFVNDVTPYEKMKIRLLNASHSLLAIPGAIQGHATIHDCMEDEVLRLFMRSFMDNEVSPILDAVEGINLKAYKDSLEERFSNPNIKDGVSRICSESSAKLPKFLIPTLLENLETGGNIRYATFLLAAWCYYSDKRVDQKGNHLEIIDGQSKLLHVHAKDTNRDSLSFLKLENVFGNLIHNDRFTQEYSLAIQEVYSSTSISASIKKMLA